MGNKFAKKLVTFGMACVLSIAGVVPAAAQGQEANGFSVQVTPSPLVATLEPGQKTTLELKVTNTGIAKEEFSMELREFSVSSDTGEVTISTNEPKEVVSFVSFEKPSFELQPSEWLNQKINIDTPKEAGFSYNFAVLVKRKGLVESSNRGALLEGSVAVFALLNVNRADATRKLDLERVAATRKFYEYLPSEITITVKNSGNTIIVPKGNVFFARSDTEPTPITTSIINQDGGSILPNTTRTFSIVWDDGFPVRSESNGVKKTVWDYSRLSSLRIGRYTARVVMIYDDGTRDVPLEGTVTFWVFPWKIFVVVILVLLLVVVGLVTLVKKGTKVFPKRRMRV